VTAGYIFALRIILTGSFRSVHSVVDRGLLQAMWEELAGQVVRLFDATYHVFDVYKLTLRIKVG